MDKKEIKNLKLQDLYEMYKLGQLEKQTYIDVMYEKHKILFDYFDYIKGTDVQSITIGNDSMYITTKERDIKLLVDRFDSRFIPIEMPNFHSIEAQEKDMLFKIASNCSVIFDIGANIGWYSLNFDKLPNVKKIYAFEPIPYTHDYLMRHLKINNASKVVAFNHGFSDVEDEKIFYWTKNETGSSSLVNIRERSEIEEVMCKVTTIDKFMENQNNVIDLIKCDVEGAELFVFKGGIETLKKFKPIIFTEMLRKWSQKFNYHPDDIIKLLSDIGYQCCGIENSKMNKILSVSSELETTNFFFFHQEKHKDIIKKFNEEK